MLDCTGNAGTADVTTSGVVRQVREQHENMSPSRLG